MTMTVSPPREIIKDFAAEIKKKKTSTAKPSKTVIDFRQEKNDGVEREIYNVPLELLRFRKDNGRIASDVLSYEKSLGPLVEVEKKAQQRLAEFLLGKDPDKTTELNKLIYANGQDNAAIITCDGFLIDGNRRRLVLEQLSREYPSDSKFQSMKVVILPGINEEGGPPSLLEIEKIENRYQLQSDGKAEYYGFDAALSIRQKEQRGFPLEDQLRDDPQYRALEDKEFSKKVKKKRQELLEPLECIDRYLDQFGRPGLYSTISKGLGDKSGRWQAFIDYSTFYNNVKNESKRQQMGIDEHEIGDLEDAAFKIIRLRDLAGIAKVHDVIRRLPKICRHSKKEILAISKDVEDDISEHEKTDEEGNLRPIDEQDNMWAAAGSREVIIHRVKKALQQDTYKEEKETPMTLLKAALKKLQHDRMDISAITISDHKEARDLASKIKAKAKELEGTIYKAQKKTKKLTTKK